MNYTNFFRYTFTGENQLFTLAADGKTQKYTMLNILILGVLFGMSDLAGSLSQGHTVPLDGKFAVITPLIFSASGLVNMVIAVLGMTLIYWSAAKAFGGHCGLTQCFHLVSISLAPFWVLAPLLNYSIRFHPDGLVRIQMVAPIMLSAYWAYRMLCKSLIAGQGLPVAKANLAVMGMVIFCVSAVYVLIP